MRYCRAVAHERGRMEWLGEDRSTTYLHRLCDRQVPGGDSEEFAAENEK